MILIRRSDNLIVVGEFCSEARSFLPLSQPLLSEITEDLTYTKIIQLRGRERYSLGGEPQNVSFSPTKMYHINNYGEVMTSVGMLTRVCNKLLQLGRADVKYIDMSPPRSRPDCYVPDFDNLYRMFQFKPKQLECLQTIVSNERGVVDATMGFGKGEVFCMLAALYPRAKFHIVAPSVAIAQMLQTRLTKYFSNVGLVGGPSLTIGSRITVFVVHSACKSDGDADFLLGDESHRLVANEFAAILARTWSNTRNFGFTGTYDKRSDNADREAELLFGPLLFRVPYEEARQLGLVSSITVRWLQINMEFNPVAGYSSLSDARAMRAAYWANDVRNRAIADDIARNYADTEKQVMILCHTTEHALRLGKLLPDFKLCYGGMSKEQLSKFTEMGLVDSSFKPLEAEERERMREAFQAGTLKRVIANSIWSTGIDAPNLEVLYRADGAVSEIFGIQGGGRLSRVASGKSGAVLIDCNDNFDRRAAARSAARSSQYKSLGWQQCKRRC